MARSSLLKTSLTTSACRPQGPITPEEEKRLNKLFKFFQWLLAEGEGRKRKALKCDEEGARLGGGEEGEDGDCGR